LKDRLVPFYPPVDCDRFQPRDSDRDSVRASWGVTSSEVVLGAVANLSPPKGTEYLIEALAQVRSRHPETKLVLVGAEFPTHVEYSAYLRRRLRALGLVEGKDVVFAGFRDDIERQMQGFDVFILGSVPNSEGTPTSIMEAMACGLPVIATDVGGVSELVADGLTGFVTPPLDPAAQAEATFRLLTDESLRKQMGRDGRVRAASQFSLDACVDAHIAAFEAALRHRLGRRNGIPARAR
jgi:glycosyltransferase involved in cell wall biosynthesis